MAVTEAQVLDAEEVNSRLECAQPQQIVRWAADRFGRDLVMTSSFGEQAAVLIHIATRLVPEIRIIFIDTGYLFPETHRFMEQLRLRLNLNVWCYRTPHDPISFLRHAGEENPEWRKDVIGCCAANKNEPMQRAVSELCPMAWLRGIRRDQSESRRNVKVLEWSDRYQCWAVSPLVNWTTRDVGLYMKKHNLPWHPLVEKGYLSIGCNPRSCTCPVAPGQDSRSGRWAGTGKLECGIHSLDSANL